MHVKLCFEQVSLSLNTSDALSYFIMLNPREVESSSGMFGGLPDPHQDNPPVALQLKSRYSMLPSPQASQHARLPGTFMNAS